MGASGVSVFRIELADRGDPAAYDYTEAGLTMDNAWHNLDVSAIVVNPDASWVLLGVLLNDPNVGDNIMFRKDGNANAISMAGVIAQVANQDVFAQVLVPCSTSQVIEYRANAALASCDIVVMGWIA